MVIFGNALDVKLVLLARTQIMTPKQIEKYKRAGFIARVAMGRRPRGGPGIPRLEPGWVADDDPLAWWCLTEWIVESQK